MRRSRRASGRRRARLNALKDGTHAKSERILRLIMRKRGDEPADRESLHQQLLEAWNPDDAMRAIIAATIADKTWERLEVRHDLLESRMTAFQLDQIDGQRRKLRARRWFPGEVPDMGSGMGVWQEDNSPKKFRSIERILSRFEKWREATQLPNELGDMVNALYGKNVTYAGEKIKQQFYAIFQGEEAGRAAARERLRIWITRERQNVARERQLYERERALRARRCNFSEKELSAKEAALDRQIGEQVRLLVQLKSKRSLFQRNSAGTEAAPAQAVPPSKVPGAGARRSRTAERDGRGDTAGTAGTAGTADADRTQPPDSKAEEGVA